MGNLNIKPSEHTEIIDKIAGYSQREVERLFERFELLCDDEVNKTVTVETFQKLLKFEKAEAEELFDAFDIDKGGSVSSFEFISGVSLFSSAKLEDKAKTIFNLFDSDRSQVLSKGELISLMTAVVCSLAALADQRPPSRQEIVAAAQDIINRYDTNKDGNFSLFEFQSVVSKDKTILRLLLDHRVITHEELRKDFGGFSGDGDIPDVDSDLEEELNHDDEPMDERTENMKLGIEYVVKDKDPDAMFDVEEASGGDQFMAVKPWVGTVKATVPSKYVKSKYDADAPEANLKLQYVHGYRCHDTRNNLAYNTKGEVVYHTAAVGISLNKEKNTQKFFINHTDDITALDIQGDKVVTGQMGRKPLICVWDSNTMQQIALFQGPLQNSITHVSISSDGKRIAAIANDPDHSIGIFDIEKASQQGSTAAKARVDGSIIVGKGPAAEALCLKFHPNPSKNMVIVSCVKEIVFVSYEKGVIKMTKGSGLGANNQQAIPCIGFIGDTVVTGSFSGSLFTWEGTSFSKEKKGAHQGNINCIWTREKGQGVITGGNDCTIKIWDSKLECRATINLKEKKIPSMNLKVRSICEGPGGSLLIGTRGGEIVEMVKEDYKVLMRGHFDDELWGLCVHPTADFYYTVGQDMMLAYWDIRKKTQIKSTKLEYKAGVLAISNDGNHLAAGCINGAVLICDPESLEIKKTIKSRTKQISEIKFTRDADLMAVGAHDSEILLYNVREDFKLFRKLKGHHSTITHIDFAHSGDFLQSNCTSYELLFWNARSGTRIPQASQFKDTQWDSWTCTIGWPVQGIWPECSDGSDINSVDRHPTAPVIATADDFSHVKLFKYPCPVEKSSYTMYVGHSSHVTNVKFTQTGRYLVSTGGNDKSIFQWEFHYDHEGEQASLNRSALENEDEELQQKMKGANDDEAEFVEEVVEGGDEALAVKPFLGQMMNSTPEKWVKPDKLAGTAPNGNLSLRYCHGYRCFEAKNTVKYSADPKKIVFIGAALGVVMDKTNLQDQTFFQMHEDDVISLAIHPSGKYAATGQMAAKGKAKRIDMFVWDIESKTMLSRMNNFHLRAVNLLSFSPDGKYLLSFGQDDNNSLAIYDWAQSLLICTSKVDQAKVTACGYKSDSEFFTCGLGHVKFWTLSGKNVSGKRGALPQELQKEAFLCGTWAFKGDKCVVGTQTGKLIPFSGGTASKAIDAHKGGVSTLCAKGEYCYSGGKDGKICVWALTSGNLVNAQVFKQMTDLTKFNPQIMSLDVSDDGKRVLCGIRGGEIYELEKSKVSLLLQGHYEGELWGLATNPKGTNYVTCGGDKTVRLWDSQNLKMIACSDFFENEMRAADWSSDGKLIVVGDQAGQIKLFNAKLDLLDKYASKFNKKDQWIEDIKFSPDCKLVAFGAHGGCSPIEVLEVVNESKLKLQKVLKVGITSALLHLDFSCQGDFVAINSQAYELLFIDINSGKQRNASSTKQEEYATWTSKIGWMVKGIFQNVDYTDVNTVHRASNGKILATGDDDGKVNLYRYPCPVPRGERKAYGGHSSHVTRTRFLCNDSKLISDGGNDKCILVWDTDFGSADNTAHLDNDNADDEIDEETAQELVKAKTKSEGYDKKSKSKSAKAKDFMFEVQEPETGDEFMAVKPWIGQMKEPSKFKRAPPNNEKAPKVNLALDFVHGYRAKDCRNNVKYLENGQIVYHAAALGIVYDPVENTQRFFNLHTDDITSMDLHPNKIFVATGEIGPHPQIFIWDTNSMQAIVKIRGGLTKGVASLSFSPSGKYLVGCAVDDNHYVAVFDTELGTLLASEKGDTAPITAVKFTSKDTEFVSVGPKHYKYWSINNKLLKGKRGQFGEGNNNILKCAAINENSILVGAGDGCLQVWSDASLSGKPLKRHEGSLDAISVTKYVVTGGSDGVIQIMDKKKYDILNTIVFDKLVGDSISPKIRAALFDPSEMKMVVGTYGSEIYELTTSDTSISKKSAFTGVNLTRGHYTPNQKWTNEIWGLLVYNDDRTLWGTCSDDATFRVWSSEKRKQIKYTRLDIDLQGKVLPRDETTKDLVDAAKGRCCDIDPTDKIIVVGCKDGTLRVLKEENLSQIKIIKHAKEWISEVKFNKEGNKLAVGSHDNAIYIYSVPAFEKLKVMKKHSSYITHLDWSLDGNNLHSNCGAYELLYWDANTGEQKKSGATEFRDEEWLTWTCVLGWPVQGIFPPGANGTDVKYVDRSKGKVQGTDYQLLATSDNFGKLNLYRYPCLQKGAEAVKGAGHSSHVTNCKFNSDDEFIYTAGGEDNCVFQWKVDSAL